MDKFFQLDKLYHFCICLVLGFIDTGLGIGAAIAKEYGDKGSPMNHWCWWDLLADFLGIICGTLLRILIIGQYYWLHFISPF